MGPCLCGDPCCGSCGDPGRCKFEEEIELLCEWLFDNIHDEAELAVAWESVKGGLHAFTVGKKVMEEMQQAIAAELELERRYSEQMDQSWDEYVKDDADWRNTIDLDRGTD